MSRLGGLPSYLDPQTKSEASHNPDLEESVSCAICNESLDWLTQEERVGHYEVHFASEKPGPQPVADPEDKLTQPLEPPVSAASMSNSLSGSNNTKPKAPLPLLPSSAGQFWSPAYLTKPPSNYTSCLIPILRKALAKSHAKGTTQRAALCAEGICWVSSEPWDSAYGCGYRNFQMACTALYEQEIMPQYATLLDAEGGPSFRNCQKWIEDAWKEGFDLIGATQLKHKLQGTMKWIGTGELYTAFTFRGIPCCLVDFPTSNSNPEVVTKWVTDYFFPPSPSTMGGKASVNSALAGASAVVQTEKMPLILQHQGHSRTVVGIEFNRTGAPNLLVFDPGRKVPAWLRKQGLSSLPLISSYNDTLLSRSNAPSTSNGKPSAGFLADALFKSDKRPRPSDSYEDSNTEERETKRTKLKGKDPSSDENTEDAWPLGGDGSVALVGHGKWSSDDKTTEMDYLSTLKVFRVNLSNLRKKDKYQILTFTLDSPLNEWEKEQRKVLRSERVLR